MGTTKYQKLDMPQKIAKLSMAVIASYNYMRQIVNDEHTPEFIRLEYRRYINAVDRAAYKLEPKVKKAFLDDMEDGRSWWASDMCQFIDKRTYYSNREKLIKNVASNLFIL